MVSGHQVCDVRGKPRETNAAIAPISLLTVTTVEQSRCEFLGDISKSARSAAISLRRQGQTKADIAALLAENEQFEPDWLGFWLIATDAYGEVCMIGLFQNPVRPKENPRSPSELFPELPVAEDGQCLPSPQTDFDQ